jgi:single-strand DNA-binding protein
VIESVLTVAGNLTGDPELRQTQQGKSVCSFSLAVNSRTKQGNEWVDGEPTFYRCTAWEELAEHIAQSLRKGHRVLIHGRLKTRTWQTNEGVDKLDLDLPIDEIGPSLQWATVQVTKVQKGQASQTPPPTQQGFPQGYQQPPQQGYQQPQGQPQYQPQGY